MTLLFEVQERQPDGTWINNWQVGTDAAGTSWTTEQFPNYEAAAAALKEHLDEIEDQINSGQLLREVALTRAHYRIMALHSNPGFEAPADDTLGALKDAQSFIEGFRGDPAQEGINELINRLDLAILHYGRSSALPHQTKMADWVQRIDGWINDNNQGYDKASELLADLRDEIAILSGIPPIAFDDDNDGEFEQREAHTQRLAADIEPYDPAIHGQLGGDE